jgi:hypothetical protein
MLKRQMKDLEQEYVESNTKVRAHGLVTIDKKIYYLDKWVVVNGDIAPTLYPVTPSLKPAKYNGKVYRNDWREMKPYTPSK